MSMTPTPITPVAPLLVVSLTGGTIQEVTTVLQDALNVMAVIPQTAAAAGLASLLMQIITGAVQRIQAQTGKPIDLSQIPIEQPLP